MKIEKVIIAGPRDYNDLEFIFRELDKEFFNKIDFEIVVGKASGVDTLAEKWARSMHHKVHEFPALWGKYGRSAGPIRNREMGEFADRLIAFGGQSKGTKNMINIMIELNKPFKVISVI